MRTSQKPTTPENNLAKLPRVLAPLKKQWCWSGWKYTLQRGKWAKPPYCADAPHRNASSTQPGHWCPFEPVLEQVQAGEFDGASILLTEDGELAGIDLDNCVSSGSIAPLAQLFVEIAKDAGVYVELSPSGTGLRFLGTTNGSAAKVHSSDSFTVDGWQTRVEMFRRTNKPLTITGLQLGKGPKKLGCIDALIDWGVSVVGLHKAKTAREAGNGYNGSGGRHHDLDDVEQIVQNGAPDGADRSAVFFSVVGSYFGQGKDADWITEHIGQFPEGIGERYIAQNRLPEQVKTCFAKWEKLRASQTELVAAPAEKSARPSRLKRKAPVEPNSDDDGDIEVAAEGEELPQLYAHGDKGAEAPEIWLIKNLLIEEGLGTLSGKTSIGKSFILVDMAVRIATGTSFLGRKVKRQSGTLIFAAEGGAKEMRKRVDTAARVTCGGDKKLPIQWFVDFPPLRKTGALDILIKMVEKARAQLLQEHEVDIGLIAFDTLAAAAGFTKANDENDAAIIGDIQRRLRGLARTFGCFVLIVDHHNKADELRGSQAKGDAPDAVLTCRGDRSKSGAISNTRLAVYKVRGGAIGEVHPYTLRTETLGKDDDGDPVTTNVVKWSPPSKGAPADDDAVLPNVDPWTAGYRQEKQQASALRLKRVMFELLADPEQAILAPVSEGGTVVKKVPQKAVQAAYFDRTLEEEAEGKTRQGRQQQFSRAVYRAEVRQLIGIGKVEGETYLWLCRSADPEANGGSQ